MKHDVENRKARKTDDKVSLYVHRPIKDALKLQANARGILLSELVEEIITGKKVMR